MNVVRCPYCSRSFKPQPEHDPDTVGWKQRQGSEPWNTGQSYGGFYRRVGHVVCVVAPSYSFKTFTKRVEYWSVSLVPYSDERLLPANRLTHWTEPDRVTAQKKALAEARVLLHHRGSRLDGAS